MTEIPAGLRRFAARTTAASQHKSSRSKLLKQPTATHNNMKAIAAYMMAVVGGNPNPTIDDVRTILGAVSIQLTQAEVAQLNDFITDSAGRTVDEMVQAGMLVLNKTSGRSAALETAVDAPICLDDTSSDESDDDVVEGGLTMFDDY